MCSDWVLGSVLFLLRLLTGKWKKSSGLFKENEAAALASIEGAEAAVDEVFNDLYGGKEE